MGFRWPRLLSFNRALHYFDRLAAGNSLTVLWIVGDEVGETRLSFAQLAERSNRIANFLRARGVRRADRILVMWTTLPLCGRACWPR